MKYKYKDGGIIKLQNAGSLPRWIQKLNAWFNQNVPQSDESAGERILNSTIEQANNAKNDEERKQIYNDSAKRTLLTTVASLAALSAPDWVWAVGSNAGRKILGNFALDTGASLATGELVNEIGRKLTGQPTTGRFVLNSIFGDKGEQLYDKNKVVQFGSDIVSNPGYALGSWMMKGAGNTTAKIIDAIGDKIKISNTIKDALKSGQLRFGNPTVYTGTHQSNLPISEFKFPFKERWDVIKHNADPNGVFFTLGGPAEKGFLAERPWASTWQITSHRPLIQTGEILGPAGTKNNMRNAIVRYGRKHGADAVEFRGIADNQLQNQNILFATDKTGIKKIGQLFKGKSSAYESPNTRIVSLEYEEPILKDNSHLPTTWTFKDDFLNSELFQKASDSVKNKFLGFLKPLTKQNPESLILQIQNQPDAATIQDYLRLVIDEKNNGKLPFGIVYDKDSGLFRRLPGNLQEIATQYHGIDSGLMEPLSEMATRSHNIKYPMGVGGSDDAFYAGFGDSGLVLPYTNREIKGKGFKFIDLYRSPKDTYDYYNQMANELYRLKRKFDINIESAFKAGDYKKAAELYAERMSMPILDQPYLIDRATRLKSGMSPALDAEQKIANQEIRRMLRPTLDVPIDLTNVKNFKFANLMSKDGVVNFADPGFSIFTGDPSKLHGNVIGGYYMRPDVPLYNPNLGTLRKWDLSGIKDQSVVRRGLVKDGVAFPSNWKLNTDNFIKFFDNPVAIHVGDFHQTSDLAKLPEQLPKLLLIPKNQVGDSVFRFDQFGIGLQKQGGKINRFKINIKVRNPE